MRRQSVYNDVKYRFNKYRHISDDIGAGITQMDRINRLYLVSPCNDCDEYMTGKVSLNSAGHLSI